MTERKPWLEPLKTALIVLLSISAVALMYWSGVFSSLLPKQGSGTLSQPEIPALSYTAASLPAAAAVTGQSGLCYGLKYDSEGLRQLYEAMSAYLGEAVGSAAAPKQISRESWLALLDEAGLYLDYDCTLPLSALSAWLGVEAPADLNLRTLILSEGSTGNVRLSWRDEAGKAYSCETAGLWKSLSAQLDAYLPNGASFARHWPSLADCDPEMLVLETLPELCAVSASGGQETAAEILADKTGIHLNSVSRYTEPDGTVVYPGESGVLRLLADGSLNFSASADFSLAEGEEVPTVVELSRVLLEELHGAFRGDELLRCDSCRMEGGSGELLFSYVCEGIPILLPAGCAARLRWEDGRLTELTVQPRSYRISATAAALLPEKQAAAAAGSRSSGGAAGLVLYDSGEGLLQPFWRVIPAEY